MNSSQNWIPLSGPGGRLPTADDADGSGYVYFACPEYGSAQRDRWDNPENATHFCPIPKAPPLPKPEEKTQEETQHDLDWDKYLSFGSRDTTNREDILDAMTWARFDGRAQLAREALGLFENVSFEGMKQNLSDSGCIATLYAMEHLRELLTKAAEEKTP